MGSLGTEPTCTNRSYLGGRRERNPHPRPSATRRVKECAAAQELELRSRRVMTCFL